MRYTNLKDGSVTNIPLTMKLVVGEPVKIPENQTKNVMKVKGDSNEQNNDSKQNDDTYSYIAGSMTFLILAALSGGYIYNKIKKRHVVQHADRIEIGDDTEIDGAIEGYGKIAINHS